MMMIHQERPRCFPKLLLCLCMLLLSTILLPSVAAVSVKTVNSKQEALTVCGNNEGAYERVIPLYKDKDGNDVFYSCAYSKERPSEFNRSKPCDSNAFGKKEGPVTSVYYECDNGKLQLLLCTGPNAGGCRDPFAPPPKMNFPSMGYDF